MPITSASAGSAPATCFPTASALASSWDVELLREVGEALGREAQALDVQVLLGPGLNMKRSPLCGRNFEYFSEDPTLAGRLAAPHVQGVQSQGVGACLKHFAANNQETDRHAGQRRRRRADPARDTNPSHEVEPYALVSPYSTTYVVATPRRSIFASRSVDEPSVLDWPRVSSSGGGGGRGAALERADVTRVAGRVRPGR